jgi:hypothetical protein
MKNINISFQIWKSMETIIEMEYTKKITLFTWINDLELIYR